jgi:hypothetical protein
LGATFFADFRFRGQLLRLNLGRLLQRIISTNFDAATPHPKADEFESESRIKTKIPAGAPPGFPLRHPEKDVAYHIRSNDQNVLRTRNVVLTTPWSLIL